MCPERLDAWEMPYTADSRISDFYNLRTYLAECIERSERLIDLEPMSPLPEPTTPSSRHRVALRQDLINEVVAHCFSAGVVTVEDIKVEFSRRNEQLPHATQFNAVSGSEIRAKLRELRGESSDKITSLRSSIARHRPLSETLLAGENELKRLRQTLAHDEERDEDDCVQSVLPGVHREMVTPLNFAEYCADVVQKRLNGDIEPLLQCMQQGFWSVYGGCEELKRMNVSEVQHKLFPLDPITAGACCCCCCCCY